MIEDRYQSLHPKGNLPNSAKLIALYLLFEITFKIICLAGAYMQEMWTEEAIVFEYGISYIFQNDRSSPVVGYILGSCHSFQWNVIPVKGKWCHHTTDILLEKVSPNSTFLNEDTLQ